MKYLNKVAYIQLLIVSTILILLEPVFRVLTFDKF